MGQRAACGRALCRPCRPASLHTLRLAPLPAQPHLEQCLVLRVAEQLHHGEHLGVGHLGSTAAGGEVQGGEGVKARVAQAVNGQHGCWSSREGWHARVGGAPCVRRDAGRQMLSAT